MNEPIEYKKDTPLQGGNNKILKIGIAGALVAAIGAGVTFFLIQNSKPINLDSDDSIPTPTPDFSLSNKELIQKHGIACKRFTSLDDALLNPEIACGIDLSDQKLTNVPSEILELKNLTEIDLSNNLLTEFPEILLQLEKIASINLANNNISSVQISVKREQRDETIQQYSLQSIDLSRNNISESDQNTLSNFFGSSVEIKY